MMKQSNSPSVSLSSDLAATPLFDSLDLGVVQAIATGAEQMALAADEWLFRQGDTSEALYVVLAGRLAVISNINR